MKKLKDIPSNFTELAEVEDVIGDSESLTEHDLTQFDKQLKPFGLEVVTFDNGQALNWYIQKKY